MGKKTWPKSGVPKIVQYGQSTYFHEKDRLGKKCKIGKNILDYHIVLLIPTVKSWKLVLNKL